MLGDVVCDAGKVEAVAVEDEAVGIGVPGGEERSQWRIAPSESPRRGSGARGAMLGLFVGNDIRSWQAKKRKTHSKLPFCVHGGQHTLHEANIEDSHSLIACCASKQISMRRACMVFSYVDG